MFDRCFATHFRHRCLGLEILCFVINCPQKTLKQWFLEVMRSVNPISFACTIFILRTSSKLVSKLFNYGKQVPLTNLIYITIVCCSLTIKYGELVHMEFMVKPVKRIREKFSAKLDWTIFRIPWMLLSKWPQNIPQKSTLMVLELPVLHCTERQKKRVPTFSYSLFHSMYWKMRIIQFLSHSLHSSSIETEIL